ncbi:LacI family DNA-binding transcriptional regulator [Loktanella sp. S4079]|uniref:LacI family DNA-binding transcriptional regulator n=1 Tax=Loktanella sp. S4079 TaxID=579483 RepID=UPI0005FA26D4|nr:LacI family DNA-binding transcriptional regulator [Loktanella sp. S4079]
MGRKVTAADVAREAGVSAATVDRVLNNRGGVSTDKERRVIGAAKRLKLDRALDLRAARTLRVAAILQSPQNPFHATVGQAFAEQNRGVNPFNIQTRVYVGDPAKPEQLQRIIQCAMATHDAIITCLPDDGPIAADLDRYADTGRPVIALAADIRAEKAIYVGPDDYAGGRIAGDLLGRFLGPSGGEIMLIGGLWSMIGQAQRRRGFEDVLVARHLRCNVVHVAESRESGDRAGELAARALRDHPNIAGIYNASAGGVKVAQAIERAGRSDLVYITHEFSDQRRTLLKVGQIDALLDQEPATEVGIALSVIAHHYGRLETLVDTKTPIRVHFRETC